MHLADLGDQVKTGVTEAGMVGMRFNTDRRQSDAISMGTRRHERTRCSRRDLIADSIETIMGAQWYDANWSLFRAATRTCPAA